MSTWDSFVRLCTFLNFFKPLRMDVVSTIKAGFGQTCAVFKHPLSTDGAFYPFANLFCYTIVFLTFFTAVTVITVVRITGVRTVNHFLETILHTFGFLFSPRMTGEPVRTSPRRLLVTLDDSEFDYFGGGENFMWILVDVCSWETRMGVVRWTDAGVKACYFNT